jgi:hypothetical protein
VSPGDDEEGIDMKGGRWGWCVAGLAIVAVGLVVMGVRPSTVLFAVAVLACPLMMLFMHGGHGGGDQHSLDRRRRSPTMTRPRAPKTAPSGGRDDVPP